MLHELLGLLGVRHHLDLRRWRLGLGGLGVGHSFLLVGSYSLSECGAYDCAVLVLAVILAAGLLAGYATGGRLRNLASARVRLWWLGPISLLLQVLPAPRLPGASQDLLGVGLLLGSYVLLLILAAANVRRMGFVLILIGVALNFIVIAANQGMPVSASALRRAGAEESIEALRRADGKHHLADEGDVLLPLADVIPVPGTGVVLSPGDLAAYGGASLFLAAAMRGAVKRRSPGRRPARRATRSGTRR